MQQWEMDLLQSAVDREVAERVRAAVARLLKCDNYLLEVDANERALSHRLGMYLQDVFPEWNVDCEYNRDGVDPKRLEINPENVRSDDDRGTTVYPDVIVHQRGPGPNLLAIEIKKANGGNEETDLRKLRGMLLELKYVHALFIRFNTGASYGVSDLRWVSMSDREHR